MILIAAAISSTSGQVQGQLRFAVGVIDPGHGRPELLFALGRRPGRRLECGLWAIHCGAVTAARRVWGARRGVVAGIGSPDHGGARAGIWRTIAAKNRSILAKADSFRWSSTSRCGPRPLHGRCMEAVSSAVLARSFKHTNQHCD